MGKNYCCFIVFCSVFEIVAINHLFGQRARTYRIVFIRKWHVLCIVWDFSSLQNGIFRVNFFISSRSKTLLALNICVFVFHLYKSTTKVKIQILNHCDILGACKEKRGADISHKIFLSFVNRDLMIVKP